MARSSRLTDHLNSQYIAAAQRLQRRGERTRIVVYVESYDDIFFWNNLLAEVETPEVGFEVMLPSRTSLGRGKKIALSNRLGPHMIACVDADYDVLMQGATPTSEMVCRSPSVLQTGVYSIENLQCYAATLQQVCVMATLNDKRIFDFEAFIRHFSLIIFPVLVWNVWAYKYGVFSQFSLSAFAGIVALRAINLRHPEQTLDELRRRVNRKVTALQRQFPEGRTTYRPLQDEILALGVAPEEAYLYMRGHDLNDLVVLPLLTTICDALRRDREREISNLARHNVQRQNELASYQHAMGDPAEMLRKHTAYQRAPQWRKIVERARELVQPKQGGELRVES